MPIRWLADENFNNAIVRAVLRRRPETDIVRIQDLDLRGASDPDVLAWAGMHGRLVLTHDVSTMTAWAYARIEAGESMPGLFEAGRNLSIGGVADEILLISEFSDASDWEGQVIYLPLR